MAALSGKLTKKLVENLGPGRHGDGSGLYLVVDPSGARRWIVRATVKGQKNRRGAPLRTDFGLGGADVVTLNQARERALEYRRMANGYSVLEAAFSQKAAFGRQAAPKVKQAVPSFSV
nr:Arm DNA-binding domain-containing protein [Ruegeria sp. THAF57]